MLELLLWIVAFVATSYAYSSAERYVEARLKSGSYSKLFRIGSCVCMLALFSLRFQVIYTGTLSALNLAGIPVTQEGVRQYFASHSAISIIIPIAILLFVSIYRDINTHFDRCTALRNSTKPTDPRDLTISG